MKFTKILILASGFATTVLSAQEIQSRNVSAFSKIEASGSVQVRYTDSDSLYLGVKAKSNELDQVETKVENNTLFISNKGNFSAPVYVYVKNNGLKQIQASGASGFKTANTLKPDSISISASGAANVNVSVNALKIKSVQSGASMLVLSGTTNNFLAELSGASSLKAYELVSKNTDIIATGASSSKIYVTDKLKANASGASNIKIRGEVKDINAEASSASSISRAADKGGHKDGSDSTFYNWKGKKIIVIGKEKEGTRVADGIQWKKHRNRDFRHWAGFFVGVNGYMSSGGGLNLPNSYNYMDLNYSRSFNFQLNLFEHQFNIIRNYFKIITGLGLDYHSYDLANKTMLNADSSFTSGSIDSSGASYKKNRLRNTYIQVPLLFEFNTSNNPHKTFHLAFGVIGQFLISSRTKQVFELDNAEVSRVRKDNYNMTPFAAKAHVNMGYRGWTIYGEYNLTPLFKSGMGPELYPFTLGIRVIPFT